MTGVARKYKVIQPDPDILVDILTSEACILIPSMRIAFAARCAVGITVQMTVHFSAGIVWSAPLFDATWLLPSRQGQYLVTAPLDVRNLIL
jgi:hypothetical protein